MEGMKKLIYVHGFGSSAQCKTIRTLRETLLNFDVIAPDIPKDPAEALSFLKQLCEDEQPDVIVGIGMGGMLVLQLFGFKRISVNPGIEIEGIELDDDEEDLVWGLFGYDENQVNGEQIFRRYYDNVVHYEGGHGLTEKVIHEVLVPLIRELAAFEYELWQYRAESKDFFIYEVYKSLSEAQAHKKRMKQDNPDDMFWIESDDIMFVDEDAKAWNTFAWEEGPIAELMAEAEAIEVKAMGEKPRNS